MTIVRRLPAVLLTLTSATIAFSCSKRFAVCEETRKRSEEALRSD